MAVSSLIVGISDCKITRDSESMLVTYALGSCIAVAMHDPITKVSGLLHYMLPESAIDKTKAEQNPYMFADTGIPHMMDALKAAGGDGKRMVVRLAGGAQVLDGQGVFQIGKRNYLAAPRILWKAGMLIAAEAEGKFPVLRAWRWGPAGSGCVKEAASSGNWCGIIQRRRRWSNNDESWDHNDGSKATKGRFMAYSVLIVDDSPVVRSFIRRVLVLSGFEVGECMEAGNGEEALEQLGTRLVDVILTDINMPGLNGEELLRKLSADGVLKNIPALVISTDATKERILHMLALGAEGYMSKPFTPETLREELERVLGERHATRA
jgi:chemotaxis receptor (MCP) glutamine deamidase CheD/CheY-like chemotaxis protein